MYICILFTMMCLEKEKERREKNRDMKIEGKNDDIKTNWEHFI